MDKPTSTMNTTDFRPALLWVMGKIGQAHKQEVLTVLDQEFGPLIPETQRRLSKTNGKELWRTNVAWSSTDLVKAGLLHKSPGVAGIWSITDAGRDLLAQQLTFQHAREEVLHRINNPPSESGIASLPTTLGSSLKPYVKLATHLNDPTYTPDQIVDRLGRISPPIAPGLTEKPDAAQLVRDLLHLRLLEPLDDGRYRRWPHLADNTEHHLLRYAALTMLVPTSTVSARAATTRLRVRAVSSVMRRRVAAGRNAAAVAWNRRVIEPHQPGVFLQVAYNKAMQQFPQAARCVWLIFCEREERG